MPSVKPKGIATPAVQAAENAKVGQNVKPQLETRNQAIMARNADQRSE